MNVFIAFLVFNEFFGKKREKEHLIPRVAKELRELLLSIRWKKNKMVVNQKEDYFIIFL